MIENRSEQFLWVEKYRPQKIDDCVLPESMKKTFKEYIAQGQLPTFLFSGTAGVGKTTVAKALCNEIGAEYLFINGSEESGEGWLYCGRGLLQLTGKANYSAFAEYAGVAVEDAPEYIETPRGAVHSACWFWYVNDCNTYADAGDVEGLTKRINGGTIGLDDRIKHYNHALHVLGA